MSEDTTSKEIDMSTRSVTLALAFTATMLAARAEAEQLLLDENFEGGLARWTLTGDWYLMEESEVCGAQVAPFPSGARAVRFGRTSLSDFCHFESSGELTLRDAIYLPLSATEATLSFTSFEDTECCHPSLPCDGACDYDKRWVRISVDGGPFITLADLGHEHEWYDVTLDLTPWLGSSVHVSFDFDAMDSLGNGHFGWAVDDVSIAVDGVGRSYCSPNETNSSGFAAALHAVGSRFAVNNDLTLHAEHMPANQFGYFIASLTPGFVAQPGQALGNLCVLGDLARFNAQVQNSGPTGTFQVPIDLTSVPTHPAQAVLGGQTWHFQGWFRDGSASNFTDAVRIFYQ